MHCNGYFIMKKLLLIATLLTTLSAQAERIFLNSNPHPQTGKITTWSFESSDITKSGYVASVRVRLDGMSPETWFVTGCYRGTGNGLYWTKFSDGSTTSVQEWHLEGLTVGSSLSLRICAEALMANK